MWRNSLVVVLFFCASGAARAAGILDLNINNDVAELKWGTSVGTGQLSFGGIYHDLSHDWLAYAGFLGRGEGGTSVGRTEAGIGGRVYGGPLGANDLLAVALGGEFTVYPSNGNIGVGGYGYYAPNVLSMRRVTRFWDAGLRVEFEVIKRTGYVYLGYRQIRGNLDVGTDVDFDRSGQIGMRIAF